MTTLALSGTRVLEASISLPRVGVWHADVLVDIGDTAAVTGAKTLSVDDGALALSGAVVSSTLWSGRVRARIVGGAAKLDSELGDRHYRDQPARVIVSDILREAGESLSSTSDAARLSVTLKHWSRLRGSARRLLGDVVAEIGATWRVLPDGTIWVGVDSWPTAKVGDYLVLDRSGEDATLTIALDSPTLLPGTKIAEGRVDRVLHRISADHVRTDVWLGDSASGRLYAAIATVMRSVFRRIDHLALYPCKVVSQNSDGTLELTSTDKRLADRGLSKIPIRYGIPGVTAKVAKGSLVLLGYEGGNPRAPFAALWDKASITEVTIKAAKVNVDSPNVSLGGSAPVARIGDSVVVMVTTPFTPAAGTIVSGSSGVKAG